MKIFRTNTAKNAEIKLSLITLNPKFSKRIDSKNYNSNIKGCFSQQSFLIGIKLQMLPTKEANLQTILEESLLALTLNIQTVEICLQVST